VFPVEQYSEKGLLAVAAKRLEKCLMGALA
jgi:hypothetical protein